MRNMGYTYKQIGKELNISETRVGQILADGKKIKLV